MKITLKDLYEFNKETGLVDSGHIKVKTKTGFKKIDAIDITARNSVKLHIETTNFNIKVSPDHLLYKHKWIKSKKLLIGDHIDTINGYEKIISITSDIVLDNLTIGKTLVIISDYSSRFGIANATVYPFNIACFIDGNIVQSIATTFSDPPTGLVNLGPYELRGITLSFPITATSHTFKLATTTNPGQAMNIAVTTSDYYNVVVYQY